MKKLSLKMKLVGGFSMVLVLMLIVAAVGFTSLRHAASGFAEYREMARDTTLSGRLQANMLLVRMNVKNYLISGSDQALAQYHDRWKLMSKFQAQAHKDIHDPKRAALVDEIETYLSDYAKGVEAVIVHMKKRNYLLNEVLNVKGPVMEKQLKQIIGVCQ